MTSPAVFDRIHGRNAFSGLRTLLQNPELSYREIGKKLGLTKQPIAQLAKQMGLDVARRMHRQLTALPQVVDKDYPANVAAVIRKLKQAEVTAGPYIVAQPCRKNLFWKSLTKVLVNGRLCAIKVRSRRKYKANGRYYARFDMGRDRGAKALLLAIIGDPMKLYVVPRSHLRSISAIYIPGDGKKYHPRLAKGLPEIGRGMRTPGII